MLARRQLTRLGIGWDAVDAQVDALRWTVRTPRVVSTTTGTLTVEQMRWLGVLHAGPRSVLGGLTAASLHGLEGWERDQVTVLVDDELSFEPVDGIRFFRSRRPFPLLVSPRPGLPSARLEPAVLLWAAYSAAPRSAVGVLAAAVQQRLTTAERLLEEVERLRPLRRSRLFRQSLGDVAGGAHSAAEIDVRRMCRLCRLPLPVRQAPRTDTAGRRRWTDCEWHLASGTVLVLEVDGSFHLDVASWTDDLQRQRRLTAPGRLVVRCTADELRLDPRAVGADLVSLGLVPRAVG